MTTPDLAAVVAALTAERYAGEWWLRRAAESMPAPDEDELTPARRRKALATEVKAAEAAVAKRRRGAG